MLVYNTQAHNQLLTSSEAVFVFYYCFINVKLITLPLQLLAQFLIKLFYSILFLYFTEHSVVDIQNLHSQLIADKQQR